MLQNYSMLYKYKLLTGFSTFLDVLSSIASTDLKLYLTVVVQNFVLGCSRHTNLAVLYCIVLLRCRPGVRAPSVTGPECKSIFLAYGVERKTGKGKC